MLKFSIFLYKKLSPAAPVTPPYSMYYIFRVWGKLKSLRKYMHFNIFERSNVLNIFLTLSIQMVTFPFNIFFAISKQNEVLPSSIFFIVNHGQIMGRSWADHGQTMGDRFMQKIPENISFFRYRFFPKIYENWRFSIREQEKYKIIFADPGVQYQPSVVYYYQK